MTVAERVCRPVGVGPGAAEGTSACRVNEDGSLPGNSQVSVVLTRKTPNNLGKLLRVHADSNGSLSPALRRVQNARELAADNTSRTDAQFLPLQAGSEMQTLSPAVMPAWQANLQGRAFLLKKPRAQERMHKDQASSAPYVLLRVTDRSRQALSTRASLD